MDNCNIRLRWNDNAGNEERYDVWMTGTAGKPRVIASLKSGKGGAVWAELTAPEAGNLSIWVETVNAIGGQPSNIISLAVEPKCAPPPTQLQIETLDITATAAHDRTYCYVSLQGAPEIRIPKESGKFIKIGKGEDADVPKQKFVTPIPANGIVNISGECWGWAGKNLDALGTFTHQFASDTWNGKPQVVSEANFKISLEFTKQGDSDGSRVIYDLPEDSHIPAPYDLKIDSFRASGPVDPKLRALHWRWSANGDPKIKVTSFAIYRYGYLVKQRTLSPAEQANPPLEWEEDITLDYACAVDWQDYRTQWQVMAQTADAVSPLSVPYLYEQEPCDRYARIFFSSVLVDCWPQKNIHGGFSLTVNGETRSFWNGNIYTWIDCGPRKNTFIEMIGSWTKMNTPQAFVVPLDIKGNPNGDVDVRAVIWNDGQDVIARMSKRYSLLGGNPADEIVAKCGKDYSVSGDVIDNRYAIFDINVNVYPNKCNVNPP